MPAGLKNETVKIPKNTGIYRELMTVYRITTQLVLQALTQYF